ncbi:unnamed protein product, partial [Didymodactylos carnosus]
MIQPSRIQPTARYSVQECTEIPSFGHYMSSLLCTHIFLGNVDGKFDANDLSIYFEKLGIKLGSDDASKLIQKMDQDGSLEITYDEWRNFFLLNPAIGEQNPSEMLQYWRAASHFDFGEASFTVPDVVIKGIINMKLVIHVT